MMYVCVIKVFINVNSPKCVAIVLCAELVTIKFCHGKYFFGLLYVCKLFKRTVGNNYNQSR